MKAQRILVLVPAGTADETLHRTVRTLAADPAGHVLALMPQPRRPFAGDAELLRCVRRMHAEGLAAEGRMGDPDCLRAIAHALHDFPATEIVVPGGELAEHVLARFGLPTVAVGPSSALLAAAA